MTEAATLALIAQLAATLVKSTSHAAAQHSVLSFLNFHQPTGTLILIGFGLCGLRLAFQVPLATLSARIAADVQARLRSELFDAFNRASWSIQSRDREGQLQEVMTSQVMQAVAGAVNTTSLISSSLQFLVLMVSAFLLSPLAALIVGVLSITLFALLRPMRNAGARSAKGLSRAQLKYAAGIAESNRVAEESHVFGAGAAQREGVNQPDRPVAGVLLPLAGADAPRHQPLPDRDLRAARGRHRRPVPRRRGARGRARRGDPRCSSGRAPTGQLVQGAYQSLIQALPFIERTQNALERYRENAESYGSEPLPAIESIRSSTSPSPTRRTRRR